MNRLIRLNTDGSRDTSFNSPIFAIGARFLGVQPDGKIIVCSGGVNLIGVPPAGSIVQTVRLNTDGTLDTTFQSPNFQFNATDPPASVASGNYFDVGVFGNPVIDSATGKIYFCGSFRFVNGQPRKAIVRCNADGTLDSSFVPTGLIGGSTHTHRSGDGATGRREGRPGWYQAPNGGRRSNALRASPVQRGWHARPYVHALSNDRFLGRSTCPRLLRPPRYPRAAGREHSHQRHPRAPLSSGWDVGFYFHAARLFIAPFSMANIFQVGGFRFDVDPNTGAAYLENPGPLYARLGGVPVPGEITKLKVDGTIDTHFSAPVAESEDFAPDVQIAASGAVYVSGYHTDFGNTANATITRLLANGTRDATYSLDALPFADKQAAGFALLPDSSAYVVYASGSFNGSYQFTNLARLLPTGALDTSFRLSSALQTAFSINAFDGNDPAKSALVEISSAPNGRVYLFSSGDHKPP